MVNDNNYYCRVCGLKESEPPWGEDGKTPSFNICSCCGTEFGYQDCQPSAILKQRQKWLDAGAKWFRPDKKPEHWNLEEQLSHAIKK
jgi:hypothetical protein